MAREWVGATTGVCAALAALLLLGVLTPAEALAGFANPAVATIGLLLVLAIALERSRWIRWIGSALLGRSTGTLGLLRALPPIALVSAFLSNTTVVAVLAPQALARARAGGEPASKVLMPLSFAAILGGACTLVGTSTNLVVQGLLEAHGEAGFGMFEFALAGAPMALAGIAAMALLAPRLLPSREDPVGRMGEHEREYVARLEVGPDCRLVGERVASLRNLRGVFLAGIERVGERLLPVSPGEQIQPGDVLDFVGMVDDIADVAGTPGLLPLEEGDARGGEAVGEGTELIEAVVSPSSPVLGRTVREAGFRGHYGAVVLAVHRHGERIHSKIGEISLRPGDTLLLAGAPGFLARWRWSRDFYLVSSAGSVPAPAIRAMDWVEPAVLAGVVLLPALGLMPLFHGATLGVLVLVLARRLRPVEVVAAFPWPTIAMIAAAIGLGRALVVSGAAGLVSGAMLETVEGAGPVAAVALVFVAAALLSELVTNVAAASLMLPIALAATSSGVAVAPLAMAVALGASTSFITPYGYHTNAMVAGPGAYRMADFLRLGLPVKLVAAVVGVACICAFWGVG